MSGHKSFNIMGRKTGLKVSDIIERSSMGIEEISEKKKVCPE
jgi:hypothetical protein